MLVSQTILSEPHMVQQFHQEAGPSLGFPGPWCLSPHSFEINGPVRKINQKDIFCWWITWLHQHQTSLDQHLSHKYTLSMSLILKHTSSFPAHTPSICLFVLLSHEWWSLSSSATHRFIYSLSNTHISALKSASRWKKKTFWPSPGHWWNKELNYEESFFHFSGQNKNSSHSVDRCQTLHLVLL